jgi:acyl-coenzyme A thioesterase 13
VTTPHAPTGAPPGFKQRERLSPFNELSGPLYSRREGDKYVLGLRVLEKHCNRSGIMHGGMVATLADVALGSTLAFQSDPPRGMVTASLTVNFAGSARVGDWLEARVDVQKHGSRFSFANCYINCGEKRIAHASAMFAFAGERRADT